MNKNKFIRKWLPSDGALEEEFKQDVEALYQYVNEAKKYRLVIDFESAPLTKTDRSMIVRQAIDRLMYLTYQDAEELKGRIEIV